MPRLAVTLLLCCLAAAVPAAATLLGGDGGPLLTGSGAVAECDDAQTVDYATSGGQITSVTVSGIADPQCSGGRLSVALTALSNGVAEGGPVTVPSDGDTLDDSVTLPVSPGASASAVDRTDVLIEVQP
jgi:hypothetical protein